MNTQRDIIDVRTVKKPRGRKRHLSLDEAVVLRETYAKGTMPNGRKYNVRDVARLFRVSAAVASAAIERKGAYK